MGGEITIGPINIVKDEALLFSKTYDPLNEHITGQKNIILPNNSVSGFYCLLVVNSKLITHELYVNIICGSNLDVKFISPITCNHVIFSIVHYKDTPKTLRTGDSVIKRISDVVIGSFDYKTETTSEILVKYSITHLLETK